MERGSGRNLKRFLMNGRFVDHIGSALGGGAGSAALLNIAHITREGLIHGLALRYLGCLGCLRSLSSR